MKKFAHWIQVDDIKCRCSNCECVAMIALYPNSADKNFCPNCGCNMQDLKNRKIVKSMTDLVDYCTEHNDCEYCIFCVNEICVLNEYSVANWKTELKDIIKDYAVEESNGD